MPCNDISDTIRIKINNENKITRYSLTKRTCGGEVGSETLILDWLKNYTVDELINVSAEKFLNDHPTDDEVIEYVLLKQFIAVRSSVATILGKESGGKDSFCTVDTLTYSEKGIVLTAYLNTDAITAEIESCGGCKTCGS